MEGIDRALAVDREQLAESSAARMRPHCGPPDATRSTLADFVVRQIIADRVGNDEITVGQPLHQRARAQPVRAVVGKVCLAQHKQPGNRAHQVVIHPQAAHRVVDGRIDAHRHLVRILVGDALVHVEQVAVALAMTLRAQPFDRVRKIEINAQPSRPTPRPSSQTAFALREATSRGTRLPKLG